MFAGLDGNQITIVENDFKNLQESKAVFVTSDDNVATVIELEHMFKRERDKHSTLATLCIVLIMLLGLAVTVIAGQSLATGKEQNWKLKAEHLMPGSKNN